MKNLFLSLTLFLITFINSINVKANNVQVSNVSLTGQNTSSDFIMVQFDLTWENSWRSSTLANWDAVWVFLKYRVAGGPWLHAFLNDSGHLVGTGTSSTIVPGLLSTGSAFNATTNPAMGAFIHRSADGAGNYSHSAMQLRWNYGSNSLPDNALVDIRLYAVEMVYIPQGSFSLGDGTTTNIEGNFRNAASNTPLLISNENALTLGGSTAGNLGNNNALGMFTADDFNNTTTQTLPASFPKGFNAFYCMKYEVSQQQWIDFFNSLSSTQMTNRNICGGSLGVTGKGGTTLVNRNNITWTVSDASASLIGGTHGTVACNFLSWMDGAAFMDWASLRPMTELEFEKVCRGSSASAVANEFAWGNTTITQATATINNSGLNNETASTGANAVFGNTTGGPLRVGNFATASSTRTSSGASFYGVMEMSGNLRERVVTIGNATGRVFTGTVHGDGLLTSDGFSDIATWPGIVTGKITGATRSCARGGDYVNVNIYMRTSDRYLGATTSIDRTAVSGVRAIRTAP